MLQLESLTRSFGAHTAVDGVDLFIPTGQMVGVIGRSGAGKSTLLRLVNRLIEPSAGRIVADGVEIGTLTGARLRRWRRDCAMIFQQFNLVPRLDVLTNVMLGRLQRRSLGENLLGRFSRDERLEALEALDRLGIVTTATQLAGTLSGGQQQRVAIARALVQGPSMVLADEPIASLDPLNARRVMDALERINRDDGLTVLVNLHALDVARERCERIVGMSEGRVVFDGTPDALDDAAVRRIYGDGVPTEAAEPYPDLQAAAKASALDARAAVRDAARAAYALRQRESPSPRPRDTARSAAAPPP